MCHINYAETDFKRNNIKIRYLFLVKIHIKLERGQRMQFQWPLKPYYSFYVVTWNRTILEKGSCSSRIPDILNTVGHFLSYDLYCFS